MSQLHKIDSYAQALLHVANETSSAGAWCQQIDKMREILRQNCRFSKIVANKQFDLNERKQLLETVFGSHGDFDWRIVFFLKVLIDNNAFQFVDVILHKFIELVDEQNNVKYVKICSAFPLSDDTLDKFQMLLAKKFGYERVHIHTVVDKSLICGVKIVTKSLTIDNSLKGKIDLIVKELLASKTSVVSAKVEV